MGAVSTVTSREDEIESLIGLEVHCQLTSLKSKLFCGCTSDYRDKPPNSNVCPVCLGVPGALPVVNGKAVEFGVMVALALGCTIAPETLFFRKNYFYPDLDKSFQISQYDRAGGVPLAAEGAVSFPLNGERRRVTIRRVHLEEDPGKLTYPGTIDRAPYVLVDYNRAGMALLEIVTEPDIRSPKDARVFLQKLRSIIEHLGVSDGALEGAMRCDANISIKGGERVEVKNISSFKEVERALNFELIRQRNLAKKEVVQKTETRHWDEARRVTVALRTKEGEADYRYFPEGDLPPITLTPTLISKIKTHLPELPDARKERLIKQYGIPEYDAEVLTSDRAMADFFERGAQLYPKPKLVANWMMGDLLQILYSLDVELTQSKITPKHLTEMLELMDRGEISVKIAKKILWEVMKTGKRPSAVVTEGGLLRISDPEELRRFADLDFAENLEVVVDALGDENAVNFLIGRLMALTSGKADPQLSNDLIRNNLKKIKASLPNLLMGSEYRDFTLDERNVIEDTGRAVEIDILYKNKKTGDYLVVEIKGKHRTNIDALEQLLTYIDVTKKRLAKGKPVEGLLIVKSATDQLIEKIRECDNCYLITYDYVKKALVKSFDGANLGESRPRVEQ